MSKLLVVKGHPLTAEYSLSLKGLDAFVKSYKSAHPEDEIEELDVFSADIPTLNTELVSAMFSGENAELTASQKINWLVLLVLQTNFCQLTKLSLLIQCII